MLENFKYGSKEWLEDNFRAHPDDPWGLCWRAIEQYRHDVIVSLLKKRVVLQGCLIDRALEIGCSTGCLTKRIDTHVRYILGLDISELAIQRARAKYPDIDFVSGDLRTVRLAPNSFDVVLCLEVLYYLEDQDRPKFLQRAKGLMKNDGLLIISSMIGNAPYYSTQGLIDEIKADFRIIETRLIGMRLYANLEAIPFRLYERFVKLDDLLRNAAIPDEKNLGRRVNKEERLLSFIEYVKRRGWLRRPLFMLSSSTKLLIKVLLSFKLWPYGADRLAKLAGLERTHTIIFAQKK